jgi:myo-inositol-1(or 4)-monophosphatase
MRSAMLEAGELALEYYEGEGGKNRNNPIWRKSDGSQVSQADMAVDKMLRDRLLGERPEYGWLSEETADNRERLARGRVWIVDPIDGTRAFLKGRPHWLISCALWSEGEVGAGCLYSPVSGKFYSALKGEGAFVNGQRLAVSQRKRFEGSSVIASCGCFKSRNWKRPWPQMSSFMVNSIALRLALVASGEADALISMKGKSDWDLAAADLIVREAGGECTNHRGEAFVFNRQNTRHASVLAAGPALHGLMLERVRSSWRGRIAS